MESNFSRARLNREPAARALVDYIMQEAGRLRLVDPSIYFEFPPFREEADSLHRSTVLVASRSHGIIVIKALSGERGTVSEQRLRAADDELQQIDSLLFGKLLRSARLRVSGREVAIALSTFIFVHDVAPTLQSTQAGVLQSFQRVYEAFDSLHRTELVGQTSWDETLSIIEGAKGLLRPKERIVPQYGEGSKGSILVRLENEVANFDRRQRRAAITLLEGPQRIRGLAIRKNRYPCDEGGAVASLRPIVEHSFHVLH